MAREIDWSKPLSDTDREWAVQRLDQQAGEGMTIRQRIELNDQQNGTVAKKAMQTRAERMEELRTIIADSTNELERLRVEQIDEDNRNAALSGDPKSGLVRDNTGVDGERPEGAPEPQDRYADEKTWTKTRLVEEIKRRNTEREAEDLEPLHVTGNRSELVERLLKDDEELEG